jgi:uncharacterized RDD family membrane protein YckC
MNATAKIWYYVDAQRQQQGPVSAAIILGHARRGLLGDDSLIWREGLLEWQPLRSLADELGLKDAPAPIAGAPAAAQPAAATATPATHPKAADPASATGPSHTHAASPYAPPAANLQRADSWVGDAGEVVPAGFLRRWAAVFIDYLILGITFQVISMVVTMSMAVGAASMGDAEVMSAAMLGMLGLLYAIYFTMAGLYFSLFESSTSQATPGKMALGIKVTDASGKRLSFGHALGRWFSALLSYLTLYIGFFMAGFTERKRALHDMVAGTLVVDRWAYTEFPERQKRELGGCLIAFLVVMGLFIVVAIFGVLAAIAIPAYQDYTRRARNSGAELIEQTLPAARAEARVPGGLRLALPARA